MDARQRSRVVRSASKFASVPGNWLALRLARGERAVRAASLGSLRSGASSGRSPIPTQAGKRACEQSTMATKSLVVARVQWHDSCVGVSVIRDFFLLGFFFDRPVGRLVLGDSKKLEGGSALL